MTTTTAPTSAPEIHPLLSSRASTRAFDDATPLGPGVVDRLLEAARWSPSASNSQPWRFAVAQRGTDEFDALSATLMGFNAVWATRASALVLVASARSAPDGSTQRWADLDAGQSLAHLTVQASAEGLVTHTMGGIEVDRIRDLYELPEGVEPLVVVAVGHRGDASALSDKLRERERAPRERRAVADLLLARRTA